MYTVLSDTAMAAAECPQLCESVRAGERVCVNFNYLVVIQLHIIKHLIFCMYERRLSQCLIYYYQIAVV